MNARSRGFSMIEVLVSILIVSVGVLALSGLLVRASSLGKTSEFRATASLLAADMADRMRANAQGVVDGGYDLAPDALASGTPAEAASACDADPGCTGTELATKDMADWQAALYANLPQGTGAITTVYDAATRRIVTDIWVMWRDPSAEDETNDTIAAAQCPPSLGTEAKATCMYFRGGR